MAQRLPYQPAKRTGPKGYTHCSYCKHKRCRPSRPLCRAMRLVKPNQRPCVCGGGCSHSHRFGGHPLCEHHPNHYNAMMEELMRPRRKAG